MPQRRTRELLEPIIAESASYSEALRQLGRKPVGGAITNIKLTCERLGIDTSHMTGQGHNKGRVAKNKKSVDEWLVMGTPMDRRLQGFILRRCLLESNVEYSCIECGLSDSWNNKPITLEVDHIDGQYWNNTIENLQFMCPNCHSQK